MRDFRLFESMNGIDEDILARSEKQRRKGIGKALLTVAGWAACFAVIWTAARFASWPEVPVTPDSTGGPALQSSEATVPTEEPGPDWEIYYNETGGIMATDIARVNGYFTEVLSEAELAAVLPENLPGEMECTGYGGFDKNGKLIEVCLQSMRPAVVEVIISPEPIARCCVIEGEKVYSYCGDVEFVVTYCDTGDGVEFLEAEAKIGENYYLLSMYSAPSVAFRQNFKALLEAFALDEDGPRLSQIVAESAGDWIYEQVTQEDALDDPDFGAWMLSQWPQGFTEESIWRHRDQYQDCLSGMWIRSHDQISWQISWFTEEDSARYTSVEDKENYDLSLYPIPRADSVPEELWTIVDNPIFDIEELTLDVVRARAYTVEDSGDSGGWRMNFSVRYGDVLVTVRAKGVDPEWVFEQLMALK